MSKVSTKPYFLRAVYEWCVDESHTPYISVLVDRHTRVPPAFVKDGQIVLNIGPLAANQVQMGNELITFQARFGGKVEHLSVPVRNVLAIYARENGEGMGFEVDLSVEDEGFSAEGTDTPPPSDDPPPPARPRLTRVK